MTKPKKPAEQDQAYELVPVKLYHDMASLPSSEEDFYATPTIYSTFNLTDPAVKGDVYDMMVEGGSKAADFLNTEFDIKDVIIFPVNLTDKASGEVTQSPCIVVITDAGDVIQVFSKGIFASINFMRMCGYKPFGPTVQKFRLIQRELSGARRMYQLVRAKPKDLKK